MMRMEKALEEIQRMHETQTVRRESIIAWYHFYARKLPKRKPERSDADLIRTVALWMKLTDRGGRPPFPITYVSELEFSAIDPSTPARSSKIWLLSMMAMTIGVLVMLVSWKVGLSFLLLGAASHIIAYKLAGGPTNPDLIKEGTTLYESEAKRVLEWTKAHGSSGKRA